MKTENDESVVMNPLISIWLHPRLTIRRIIDNKNIPNRNLILVMVAGILESINNSIGEGLGDDMSLISIFTLALLIGPIGGLIAYVVVSWLIKWTGKWFGGHAEVSEIQVAVAWANVPYLATIPLVFLQILLYSEDIFLSVSSSIDFHPVPFFILLGVEMILGIWAFVTLVKGVAEVQQFSAWRSLGNILTAFILPFVVILIFILIIVGL